MSNPDSGKILESIDELLESEGLSPDSDGPQDKFADHLLPVLEKSRDIQSYLYSYEPPHAKGLLRKAKNTFLSKMRNIIVNVMERVVMRQQKFNEMSYQSIKELHETNQQLQEEIQELKQKLS